MKFRKNCLMFLFMIYSFYISNSVFAKTLEEEVRELKSIVMAQNKRIVNLENKLNQSNPAQSNNIDLKKIEQHVDSHLLHRTKGYQINGLRIGLGSTFIYQGTSNANGDNLTKNGEDVSDVSYSIDMEFEQTIDDYSMAFIHLETGDGANVEDELKVFSNVNRDADDSDNVISLTEVWYERYFKLLPITLTAGKIDPTVYIETNEYANDEAVQFLGRLFRNSSTIEFPDNSAGIRFKIEPSDFLDFEILALDSDSDWENVFDDIFAGAQLSFHPNFFERNGNYRIIGWFNDDGHTEWNNAGETSEKGYGFGISFDQEITDHLGLFCRYGWQDPDVFLNGNDFSLEYSWSFGGRLLGSLWGRNDDILGIAFGQEIASDKYKNANVINAKTEDHLELYYNFKLNDNLRIIPDIQIIWDPFGGDALMGDSTIIIAGLRGQVDF